jgi:hypothetical protein
MTPLRFHQLVSTPGGIGLVQGRIVKDGEPEKILVSHKKAPGEGGIWTLVAYLPGCVKPVEQWAAAKEEDAR